MLDTSSYFTCSSSHVAAATATILLTTLDDCVWLLPFLHASSSRIDSSNTNETEGVALETISPSPSCSSLQMQYSLLFIGTLTGMTAIIGCGTVFIQQYLVGHHVGDDNNNEETQHSDQSLLWSTAGASLCWILAGYFFIRSWYKKRKRQRMQLEREQREQVATTIDETQSFLANSLGERVRRPVPSHHATYGTNENALKDTLSCIDANTAMATDAMSAVTSFGDAERNSATTSTNDGQHLAVVSLTLLGALDEISYFPALIVGSIFTVTDLIMASLLAGTIMIVVVQCCLQTCRPLLTWLDDHVPLYAVISIYAALLTLETLWEYSSLAHD